MKTPTLAVAATLLLAGAALADEHRTDAPEDARAYIISPQDGATVANPVTIVFGLEGMGVAPAGTNAKNTGHHHLLINTDPSEIDMGESLPATDQIVHFGGGQTQVTKELPAGTHELQLLLGDMNHVPHDPPILSEVVTITVE
jgi:hypothetical protein